MLTPGFGDGDVDQVSGPGDRTESEEHGQVVIETRLGVLEPGQAGTELGLKVQPTGEEGPGRQDHHEDGTLVKLGVGPHANGVPPVVEA